jgi:triacylglycerol lipase
MRIAGLIMMLVAGCQESALSATDGGAPDLAEPQKQPTQWPQGQIDGSSRKPYPIVLAHGMSGFKNIGPLDYFYGVADALTADGHQVFVSQVDAFNSSEVRGAQLQTFIQGVITQTGAARVNLICHSQGGFDCRYAAHQIPDQVASVTTIATPHRGDPIADIAENDLPGPLMDAVNAFLNILGTALDQGQNTQNAELALSLCSTKGANDFTAKYPNMPQVDYYSIAGRSNGVLGDDTCGSETEAPFVARWDSYVDPVNPLLAATGAILSNDVTPPPTNDGLVPVGSAKWGTFLGCIPADHLDEVGQIAGQSPGSGNPFDHILFYRQLADWLVARGY